MLECDFSGIGGGFQSGSVWDRKTNNEKIGNAGGEKVWILYQTNRKESGDVIQIDLRSSQPIYEQIISQYKYMLLQGYLRPGDGIPSVRKLALELDITPGTVAKAYKELEQQNIIETIRGRGTYIAADVMLEETRNEEVIQKVKEELRQQCMELIYQGMDKKEIVSMVEEVLDSLMKGVEK